MDPKLEEKVRNLAQGRCEYCLIISDLSRSGGKVPVKQSVSKFLTPPFAVPLLQPTGTSVAIPMPVCVVMIRPVMGLSVTVFRSNRGPAKGV